MVLVWVPQPLVLGVWPVTERDACGTCLTLVNLDELGLSLRPSVTPEGLHTSQQCKQMLKSCPTSCPAKHPTKARPPLGDLWSPLSGSLRLGALHSSGVTHFLFGPGIWKTEKQQAPWKRLGPPTRALKGQSPQARALGGGPWWALVLGGVLMQLGFETRESAARSHCPPLFP